MTMSLSPFVCPFIRSSRFFNPEAFEPNIDVLMFLVFHQCFTNNSTGYKTSSDWGTIVHGTTAPGGNCTSHPFQDVSKRDKKQSWSIHFKQLSVNSGFPRCVFQKCFKLFHKCFKNVSKLLVRMKVIAATRA